MEEKEIKNEVKCCSLKNLNINKNVVICILSVSLVLVSALAIGLAARCEKHESRHGNRNNERQGMMVGGRDCDQKNKESKLENHRSWFGGRANKESVPSEALVEEVSLATSSTATSPATVK